MYPLKPSSRWLRSVMILLVATATVSAALGTSQVASGQGPDVGPTPPGNGYQGQQQSNGSQAGTQPAGTPTGPSGPPVYYAWELDFVEKPGSGPDGLGGGCWGVTTVGGPRTSPPPAGQSYEAAAAEADYYGNNGTLWKTCPAAEAFDLVAYVNQYWSAVVKPPPPSPLQVKPGKMLVAFTAYLEIGGDPNPSWSLTNPIGPTITIRATPRYVVSWGDGASLETDSQGVPYPGGPGEITHAYRDDGNKTITVRAYWRGEWSAGGDGGQLPELPVPTSSDLNLPVESAEAVTD